MTSSKYQEALKHFGSIVESQRQTWPDIYWHGQIENCDICSRPMIDERFMIDGPVSFQAYSPWGNLCIVCAYKYSPVIGWGKAQLYESRGSNDWQLVAGGPPTSEPTF